MTAGILAIALWITIRIIAGLDIPILSPILRWWWNISFTIAAFIPFCGWMSHFIITKGDKKAEVAKAQLVSLGRETDDSAFDMLGQSAERTRIEIEERQLQMEQEEEERNALEEDLKNRTYRKYGTRDVHLNSDGSKVRVGNSDYFPTEELKKNI